ncbi:hypothetical protein HK097_000985 [Rhizophlyctis rosea]|uniref:SH3 domain-containing protein n=1 Tax=Rhizophlyctis rosea TaxID=64517 RepID=A0AAD5X896_9FUNG|nr:hypothetical protein HK097_000985 [Rhizophlyctis rosea]
MAMRFLTVVAIAATLSPMAAAQPIIGTACTFGTSANSDQFACEGSNFLSCDPATSRWTIQNSCGGPCTDNPIFASNCNLNSRGAQATTTTATATGTTTVTSTSTASATPTTTSNTQPKSSTNTGAIIGGVVAALIVLGAILAFLIMRRRKAQNSPSSSSSTALGKNAEEGASLKPNDTLNVVSVLEKKYVVQHAYEPAAEDEIRLQPGESVKLDLLFNDGWAKGTNESSGKSGLLPVACLKQVE